MTANPHQPCQTCQQWCQLADTPALGMCREFVIYRSHHRGENCDAYLPLDDGAEVIRRGQAIMEAESAGQ